MKHITLEWNLITPQKSKKNKKGGGKKKVHDEIRTDNKRSTMLVITGDHRFNRWTTEASDTMGGEFKRYIFCRGGVIRGQMKNLTSLSSPLFTETLPYPVRKWGKNTLFWPMEATQELPNLPRFCTENDTTCTWKRKHNFNSA